MNAGPEYADKSTLTCVQSPEYTVVSLKMMLKSSGFDVVVDINTAIALFGRSFPYDFAANLILSFPDKFNLGEIK